MTFWGLILCILRIVYQHSPAGLCHSTVGNSDVSPDYVRRGRLS